MDVLFFAHVSVVVLDGGHCKWKHFNFQAYDCSTTLIIG